MAKRKSRPAGRNQNQASTPGRDEQEPSAGAGAESGSGPSSGAAEVAPSPEAARAEAGVSGVLEVSPEVVEGAGRPEVASSPEGGQADARPPEERMPEEAPASHREEDVQPSQPGGGTGGIDWLTVALVAVALINIGLWIFLRQASSPPFPAAGTTQPGSVAGAGPGAVQPGPAASPGASPGAVRPSPPASPGAAPGAVQPGPAASPGAAPGAVRPGPAASPVRPSPTVRPTMPAHLEDVSMGPRDQYVAAVQILEARGVDSQPVKDLYEKAVAAGQARDREAQVAAELEALEAAGRLLDESYGSEIARLQKGAPADRIKTATALVQQGRNHAKTGGLTTAVLTYQRALQALSGR